MPGMRAADHPSAALGPRGRGYRLRVVCTDTPRRRIDNMACIPLQTPLKCAQPEGVSRVVQRTNPAHPLPGLTDSSQASPTIDGGALFSFAPKRTKGNPTVDPCTLCGGMIIGDIVEHVCDPE